MSPREGQDAPLYVMRLKTTEFSFAPARAAVLAALAAAVPAVAQSGAAGVPQAGRVDAGTGEVLPPWNPPRLDLTEATPRTIVMPQDDAYSVTGLFNEMHGEFLQNAFQFRNNLRLAYRHQDKTEVSSEDGDFSWDQFDADAFVPMPLDPDMLLLVGGRGSWRKYDFNAGSGMPDEDLYETSLHLGLGRFLTEDLYVEAVFRPGLYTDFGGTLTGDDWKFYGDVIATYRFDPGFYGRVGLVYDGTFDRMPVYPVLGFGLMINEQFRLDMLLPKSMELSWSPDPSWIVKVGLAVDGDEFHARTDLSTGAKTGYDIRVQELDLYVDGTLRFSDNLSVFGRVGSALTGDQDWEYPRTPPGRYDGSADPALFFQVGLGLNF